MRECLYTLIMVLMISACENKAFQVPTPAMEPTIPVGTRIWLDSEKPARGDIIIFHAQLPGSPPLDFVFRMVAISGDSLVIDNGRLFVNGRIEPGSPDIYYQYLVRAQSRVRDRVFDELGITDPLKVPGGHMVFTDRERAAQLESMSFIEEVEPMIEPAGRAGTLLEPDFKDWNRDHFGPYYIPGKGDLIEEPELSRYNNLILTHEGVDVAGKSSYRFRRDYCFVMGDNRHNAMDSRYIGLIPMDDVRGRAEVLF